MKRSAFLKTLGLLGLTSCLDDEIMNIKKCKWWYDGNNQSQDDFTNINNQQGFLLIGDSTVSYSGNNTAGPTPSAGTVYEFDGSSIVQVSAGYLINSGNAGTDKGDPWPKFGIDYYAATGKKSVFCDTHKFNSTLYATSAAATTNWIYSTSYLKDGLYTAMKTKADNALAALSLTKFKAIFIFICYNDVQGAETVANIDAAYRQLITNLQTDFPGSPIRIVTQSKPVASTQTQRQIDVRYNTIQMVSDFTDVEICWNAAYAFSMEKQTGAHFNQDANNTIGASLALYVNDSDSDTDVKRIRNGFYTPISSAHRDAWKTFIDACKANGAWDRLDYLLVDVAVDINNQVREFIGHTCTYKTLGGYSFVANSGIGTSDSSNTYQQTFYAPAWVNRNATVDDIIVMSKVKDNTSPLNTQGYLFGGGTLRISQHSSGGIVRWGCFGATSDYVGDNPFADDTWYGVFRSASNNQGLLKGSTTLQTSSNASTGLVTNNCTRGALATVGPELTSTHEAFFSAKYSGFPLSSFLSDFDTLLTALKS